MFKQVIYAGVVGIFLLVLTCYAGATFWTRNIDRLDREYPIGQPYDPNRPWLGSRGGVLEKMRQDR